MVADARRRLLEYRGILERLLSERGGHDLETASQALTDTTAALERIDEGLYGSCERCGGAIGSKRLLALPMARFCSGCALARRTAADTH